MTDQAIKGPYPGLRPFDVSDSSLFFGREAQVEEVAELLRRHRFLAVLGPSGSGKSSLVRAGVLPGLRARSPGDGGSEWRVVIARPGGDPIRNLATAIHEPGPAGLGLVEEGVEEPTEMLISMTEATLRRSVLGLCEALRSAGQGPGVRVLVVIDQFEELFFFKRDQNAPDDAAAFVKLLLRAAEQSSPAIGIVVTMRSEYVGDCAQFRDLPQAINRGAYLVPRMTRMELRKAIVGPAAELDLEVSERLVQRLLNDVGDDPDQLPVMQHSLMRTWQAWEQAGSLGAMEPDHYTGTGGMKEALTWHADEALTELVEGLDEHAASQRSRYYERLLQAITTVDPARGLVRRPTRLGQIEEIIGAEHDEAVEIVEAFRRADRSFLMPPPGQALTDDTMIDISHESLIRKWDLLRGWVDDEDRDATFYRRLAEAAREHFEGHGSLRQGSALRSTEEWLEDRQPTEAWALRYHPGFADAMKYVRRSVDARKTATRRKWFLGLGFAGAGALVAVLAFSTISAAAAARESEQRAAIMTRQVANMTQQAAALEVSVRLARQELLDAGDDRADALFALSRSTTLADSVELLKDALVATEREFQVQLAQARVEARAERTASDLAVARVDTVVVPDNVLLSAAEAPRVAVVELTSFMMGNDGTAVYLGKATAAMLVTEFSGRDGIEVIERAELNEMLREQDFELSGRMDEASAVEIGKLLGAQYVLYGQITSIIENLRVDLRAVDVETSEIVSVLKRSDRTRELLAIVVSVVDEFGVQSGLFPPSPQSTIESIPLRATVEFGLAVDSEDRGEIEQAIERYEAALQIYPNHRDARRALTRLRGGSDR